MLPRIGYQHFIHVIEHFSYHTGQIAYVTKMADRKANLLLKSDLGSKQKIENRIFRIIIWNCCFQLYSHKTLC